MTGSPSRPPWHKTRIKDLVQQLMPMTPLTGDVGRADLAVLERYADPRALLAAGPAQLTALISAASRGHQGQPRAAQRAAAAQAAIDLYGPDDPAVPFADLTAEVATEIRLLQAIQAEMAAHAAAREARHPGDTAEESGRHRPRARPGRRPQGADNPAPQRPVRVVASIVPRWKSTRSAGSPTSPPGREGRSPGGRTSWPPCAGRPSWSAPPATRPSTPGSQPPHPRNSHWRATCRKTGPRGSGRGSYLLC